MRTTKFSNGKIFNITTNKSSKTATIEINEIGSKKVKYKANSLSLKELEDFEYMTINDIQNWLNTNNNYFEVK